MPLLPTREALNNLFVYTLCIFSSFSIAGTEASIVLLYLLGIYGLIKTRSWPRMENPLLWIIFLFTAFTVVNGMLGEYGIDPWESLRSNWRLLLPFVLIPLLEQVDEKKLLIFFSVSSPSSHSTASFSTLPVLTGSGPRKRVLRLLTWR